MLLILPQASAMVSKTFSRRNDGFWYLCFEGIEVESSGSAAGVFASSFIALPSAGDHRSGYRRPERTPLRGARSFPKMVRPKLAY